MAAWWSEQMRKLGQESNFPLVADGQDADFVARDHKSVQGDVSRVAVRNDQFAQVPLARIN